MEKIFIGIDKYNKYILDENYCSDFKEEDINYSDISDVDINEVIKEVAKNIESKDNKNEDEIEDNNDINKLFMQQIVKFKNAKEVKEFYYKDKLNINIKEEQGLKERDKLFNKYLEGLQWILYYYYNSIKSWKWHYPYHYAPMISDYSEINIDENLYNLYDIFDKDKSEPFTPYQSLLFILPPESFNLLPECYKEIPIKMKEYFPDTFNIDYNGKIAEYESLLLLPFIDEEKMVEMEKNFRKLNPEEETGNKWGKSIMFSQNNSGEENIVFNDYEIYQKNEKKNISKQNEIKKCDFSFPTMKTIDYDYQLITIKQYFGRTSYMTKQINIIPKISENINMNKIYWFLENKSIFVDYPYKAFGELRGFIYYRAYHYMYNKYLYIDYQFRLTNDIVESIRYSYQKKGIILQHPEILCDVAKLVKVEGNNELIFKEDFENYIPYELTSLNATNKDFQKLITKINKKYGKFYLLYSQSKFNYK